MQMRVAYLQYNLPETNAVPVIQCVCLQDMFIHHPVLRQQSVLNKTYALKGTVPCMWLFSVPTCLLELLLQSNYLRVKKSFINP
jgi:hypothetical protein